MAKKKQLERWLAGKIISALLWSLRKPKIDYPPEPAVILSWHEHVLAGSKAFAFDRNVVVSSVSEDSKTLAKILKNLGWDFVLGSSNHKAYAALKSLIEAVKQRRVFITADGPKGPRHKLKQGGVVAALRTGTPIYGLEMSYPCWIIKKSWDQMRIPKPFSQPKVFFSLPLLLDKTMQPDEALAVAEKMLVDLSAEVHGPEESFKTKPSSDQKAAESPAAPTEPTVKPTKLSSKPRTTTKPAERPTEFKK